MSIHAFDFLASSDDLEPSPIIVLHGDDVFLKSRALRKLQDQLVGGGDGEMSVMQFDGDAVQWKDVADELSTISLFGGGGPRVVIVKEADPFLTKHRGDVEAYLAKPSKNSTLILTVSKWLKTTRVYKTVEKIGQQIECRAPIKARGKSVDENRVVKWIQDWAKQSQKLKLNLDSSRQVLDLVGMEFGLIDQSLAKLALFADDAVKLDVAAVKEIVGGWQTKTTWDLIDAAVSGDAAGAIEQLHRLLQSGQHANALYGQIAWSLRRYAYAAELFYRGKRSGANITFDSAMEQAGFRKWPADAFDNAKAAMKQLGRKQIDTIYQWLVETDLELKGTHSTPHRSQFALERLIFRMSKETAVSA